MLFPKLHIDTTFDTLYGFWCFWCPTGGFLGCQIHFWWFQTSSASPYMQAHSLMVFRKSVVRYNFWFLMSRILVQSNLKSVLPTSTMYMGKMLRTFHVLLGIESRWRETMMAFQFRMVGIFILPTIHFFLYPQFNLEWWAFLFCPPFNFYSILNSI